ncbi:MAG: acyltransferase [Nitrospira sp.]|nr:acyltransferase [Nitrospira sp.]MDH5348809.1 acyltransferase [Nitrospira sp.]MDH5499059.1 acyltransferase [Nitrospira sp.]MDH5726639.1 acyltransferase [Nitrospira sp.]
MIGRAMSAIISNPLTAPTRAWDRLVALWISQNHNIEVVGKLILNGRPLIDIRKESKLYIGDRVTLNSRNRGYHVNMHSPVKLFADKPGAVIRIGDNTRIHGTCIHAHESIEIGNNCLIAANCQIFDGNGHDTSFPDIENRIHTSGESMPIRIEDNVWIGVNSIILPGVTIGKGSIISANSVVNKYIPPMVIAGGNPAKVLSEHHMGHRLKSG